MKRTLFLLSLAAAYLATPPSDAQKIADLHKLRVDAFKDDPMSEEEAGHVASFFRALETVIPTADAKASAERLAKYLEGGPEAYSFESPNGEGQPGKPSSPESSPDSEQNPPPPEQTGDAPPADEGQNSQGEHTS